MSREVKDIVKAARRVSTPLLAIGTADQQALQALLCETIPDSPPAPKLTWDCVRGLRGINEAGMAALAKLDKDGREASISAAVMLETVTKLPNESVLFAHNFDRQLADTTVVQALANLRDLFKTNRRTFVAMGPSFELPAVLQSDVIVLDEALPDDAARVRTLATLYGDAELGKVPEDVGLKAAAATRGLSLFAAEQVLAMSLRTNGLDLDDAWDRKAAAVNQTPGLTLQRGGATFDSIGGLAAAKQLATDLFSGPEPADLVVRLDELDKAVAGSSGGPVGDNGVSADRLSQILQNMEDEGWTGIVALGPPGAGKTFFSNAVAATFGVPQVAMDLGAMMGGIMGESQQKVRQAMRVVRGLGGRKVWFIGTCNAIDTIPSSLRRRFTDGFYFFDLCDADEKAAIWPLYLKKFNLKKQQLPDDTNWTGAEIRNCCRLAYRTGGTLVQAATKIVPVYAADQKGVEQLRELAHERFLSASYPGLYRRPTMGGAPALPSKSTGRTLNLRTPEEK